MCLPCVSATWSKARACWLWRDMCTAWRGALHCTAAEGEAGLVMVCLTARSTFGIRAGKQGCEKPVCRGCTGLEQHR